MKESEADFSDPNKGLQQILDLHVSDRRPLRVLEAGCGSSSHLQLPAERWVVGIDISAQQLERNEQLDEKIVGDLQTFQLPANSYDLIICWDVVEHLDQPAEAIKNMAAALSPGGMLVVAAPHPWSFKGMVTRVSPHWLHVWFYRYLIGDKLAGVDGRGPFATPMKSGMFPANIARLSAQLGLRKVLFYPYQGPVEVHVARKSMLYRIFAKVLKTMSRTLSGQRWDTSHSDFFYVVAKV